MAEDNKAQGGQAPPSAEPQEAPAKEAEEREEQFKLPESLPVLPLTDAVVYPFMVLPLFIDRESAIAAIDAALSSDRLILLLSKKADEKVEPDSWEMYQVGTVAAIMKMLKLPDGRTRVIIQGITRAGVKKFVQRKPYTVASIEKLDDREVSEGSTEVTAWMRNLRESMERAMTLGKSISPELMMIAANVEEPGRLADLAATTLEIELEQAQSLLEETDPMRRLMMVHKFYSKELQVLAVQQRIASQAQNEMEKSQREYFLRQQLKAIQEELGVGDEYEQEFKELKEKIAKVGMPKAANKEAERQLEKLQRMNPDAAEAAVLRNYLDVLCDLPWSKSSRDRIDL
jgi:ATP-dependent Lon protease